MKPTTSRKKKDGTPIEPPLISKLQRSTAAQIAREQARAAWRQRASQILLRAVGAAVALRILTMAAQPCVAAYRSQRHLHVLQQQLRHERERKQHLLAEISYLKCDQGVEEEARKLGWTRAGEVSLQIVAPAPKPGTSAGAASDPTSSADAGTPVHVSGSERLRLALEHWLSRRR